MFTSSRKAGAAAWAVAAGSRLAVSESMNRTVQLVLVILLVLLLLGALPLWPYSSGWGYFPSGGLGLLLIILVVIIVMGGGNLPRKV